MWDAKGTSLIEAMFTFKAGRHVSQTVNCFFSFFSFLEVIANQAWGMGGIV